MRFVNNAIAGGTAIAAAVVGISISVALYSHAVSAAPRAAAQAAIAEAHAESAAQASARTRGLKASNLDRTGRRQIGTASFYADRYFGKPMADGTPMRPNSNNAASVTLPLGTMAKVTNLDTGHSALVTIRDRGPYVKGRIIDLSPATARTIGLVRSQGLARVEVRPLAVPQADGSLRRIASLVHRDSGDHS